MSPPSSTATVTGGAGLLPSLVLVAADFAGGWSGCSEKSAGVKSSRTELSEASRFLYAAWTSLGPIGTSRGTSRYGNTCSATRLKTGAATWPPSCCPTGESSDTRIVTAGLLIGAKPVNEAINCVLEYRPVAGSIFCAEPVFPAAVQPRSEEHTSELQSRENLVC